MPAAANFHFNLTGNGALRFGNGYGWGYLTGNKTVADGKWHHVAAVWDGSTASPSVDGVLGKSGALSGTQGPGGTTTAPNTVTGASASPWRIGLFQSNNGEFAGSIDEVQVYARALNGSEIGTVMNSGGGGGGGANGITIFNTGVLSAGVLNSDGSID